VMSLLHRRSYNNVQRPAFRRNPNVPVITQPWTILRHHDYYTIPLSALCMHTDTNAHP
jgi:hypothetical protein